MALYSESMKYLVALFPRKASHLSLPSASFVAAWRSLECRMTKSLLMGSSEGGNERFAAREEKLAIQLAEFTP